NSYIASFLCFPIRRTHVNLGEYLKAIEYHKQHLAIAQEIKYREGESNALGGLGNAYLSLGDYPKALEYYQQDLAIKQDIKDRRGESNTLGNLGITYWSLGNYPKSIEYQQQRLAIAREIKDRQGEGAGLGNLGLAYSSLGDYLKAIEYHKKHLAIAREIKDRKAEGQSLGNLGLVYLLVGDYPKAIENFKQHLAITRKIKDRQAEATMLGNLGSAYGILGNRSQAIEYFEQHLAIAQEIKDRQAEGIALNNLGYEFYKQGNLTLAESTLFAGINVLESLRERLKDSEKVSIFDTQRGVYQNLQKVLIAQNKTNAALEISERGRARAFVELISSRLPINSKSEVKSPKPPTIDEMKQIAKAQNSTLVQYSIISGEFKVKGKLQFKQSELYIWVIKPTGEVVFRKADLNPLWQQQNSSLSNLVTKTLESFGVAIDTTRSANNQQSFAVGDLVRRNNNEDFPNDPAWKVVAVNPQNRTLKIRLITWEDNVKPIERTFAQVTKVSSPQAANTNLQQLHKILIDPIADLLPKDPNARVTFIPQGSLFFVPFPALQDPDRKYLIEKHTILTAPAIQVLDLTRKQRQKLPATVKDALIIGNPTMPKVSKIPGEVAEQLPPLPNAEIEAKQVAQLFNTQAITGNQATTSLILQQLPKARIVHFATHGLLDDFTGGGVPGAIALAPEPINKGKEEGNNGLLTASEIFDLKLNAELVVLSACNTGVGRITGDGVIGLSRSLISAGVPSVIVSLWSIPDAPTASLMTEFYQRLQQGDDKASALRQAMLTTMEKHPDPKNWAAFTLIGESN
ncbi:CHAT domain-containing tetratricopeptide repeat protein, partial [Nostoc sp. ChiQUE01b]|uniref:CHAT domain-containing protein n=1 Tax=Nostoc sp. ChiQUE01b TaxID=3075376 RepID=UPI002AD58C7C